MDIPPFLYHRIIDPLLSGTRARIRQGVEPGATVIDIACGTGELVRELGPNCSRVTGVDIWGPNIAYARKQGQDLSSKKILFLEKDASDLSEFESNSFDYSVLALAIHQFSPEEREKVLAESIRVSARSIWMDYAFPSPAGSRKAMVHFAERVAGKQHYRNYRDFMGRGGLAVYSQQFGLRLLDRVISGSGIFEVCTFEKPAT